MHPPPASDFLGVGFQVDLVLQMGVLGYGVLVLGRVEFLRLGRR